MAYVVTRSYDPDRLPENALTHSHINAYQWARRTCSEGFRNQSDGVCGPPVIEAFMAGRKRSPGDRPGRWWVLCQSHADRRGVWELPDVSETQLALELA